LVSRALDAVVAFGVEPEAGRCITRDGLAFQPELSVKVVVSTTLRVRQPLLTPGTDRDSALLVGEGVSHRESVGHR
jgi:hypothetical protein